MSHSLSSHTRGTETIESIICLCYSSRVRHGEPPLMHPCLSVTCLLSNVFGLDGIFHRVFDWLFLCNWEVNEQEGHLIVITAVHSRPPIDIRIEEYRRDIDALLKGIKGNERIGDCFWASELMRYYHGNSYVNIPGKGQQGNCIKMGVYNGVNVYVN